MTRRLLTIPILALALAACVAEPPAQPPFASLVPGTGDGPPDAPEKACWSPTATQDPAGQRLWLQTVCPDLLTKDKVSTLQRALAARGFFEGEATGILGDKTKAAVRAFQASRGLDSADLSLATAQYLGILEVSPDRL
jgi:hypothetical protein